MKKTIGIFAASVVLAVALASCGGGGLDVRDEWRDDLMTGTGPGLVPNPGNDPGRGDGVRQGVRIRMTGIPGRVGSHVGTAQLQRVVSPVVGPGAAAPGGPTYEPVGGPVTIAFDRNGTALMEFPYATVTNDYRVVLEVAFDEAQFVDRRDWTNLNEPTVRPPIMRFSENIELSWAAFGMEATREILDGAAPRPPSWSPAPPPGGFDRPTLPFVAVERIAGIPNTAMRGIAVNLNAGTVVSPVNATNYAVEWHVLQAGDYWEHRP